MCDPWGAMFATSTQKNRINSDLYNSYDPYGYNLYSANNMAANRQQAMLAAQVQALYLEKNKIDPDVLKQLLGAPGVVEVYKPTSFMTLWRNNMSLSRIKNISSILNQSQNLEEIIELYAVGLALAPVYSTIGIPEPEWLAGNLELLLKHIQTSYRSIQLAELKKLDAEIDELKSKEERRKEALEKQAALREQLGLVPKPVPNLPLTSNPIPVT